MGEAKRKREAILNGACPCGSSEVARLCCFENNSWNKQYASLGLRNLPSAGVVDRCYMKELGSCIGPISGEHLISKSVLEVLKGDGDFSLSGAPWLEEGEQRILPIQRVTANCLCKEHNTALSPLDAAAGYFFKSLKNYLEADAGSRHALCSGNDIERWLLKTAKALAVSGNLARGRERLSGAFARDNSIINMLDDPAAWPEGSRLYCRMSTGDLIVNHSRFQLVPLINENGEIDALEVSMIGLIFVLLLEPLDDKKYPFLRGAKYRPGRISISGPKSNSWVTLSWHDRKLHDELKLQFLRPMPQTGAEYSFTK